MKCYNLLFNIAGSNLPFNISANQNVEKFFGECLIDKGKEFPNAAWDCKVELPFEFVWIWEKKHTIPTRMIDSADIVLIPKCNLQERILIFDITK